MTNNINERRHSRRIAHILSWVCSIGYAGANELTVSQSGSTSSYSREPIPKAAEAGCINGIESVKKNAVDAAVAAE